MITYVACLRAAGVRDWAKKKRLVSSKRRKPNGKKKDYRRLVRKFCFKVYLISRILCCAACGTFKRWALLH